MKERRSRRAGKIYVLKNVGSQMRGQEIQDSRRARPIPVHHVVGVREGGLRAVVAATSVASLHRHTVTPSHRRHPHPPHCPHAKGGAPRGAPPCVHHASAPLRETLDWWRGMWLERNLKRRPAPRQRRRRRGPVSTILGIAGFMEHTEDEARRLEGGSGGVPNLPGSRGHGEPGHAASLNARSGATCGLRPGTLRGPLARRDGRKPWRVFGITQNNRPTPCSSCTRDCMSASK